MKLTERSGRAQLVRIATTIGVFVVSASWAKRRHVPVAEEAVFEAVNSLPSTLERPVWMVMQAGSFPAVGVAAVGARVSGRRRLALRLGLAGTTAWIACKVVKQFVRRGRPEAEIDKVAVRGHAQSGLGFPSGHSAVAFAMAASLGDSLPAVTRVVSWAGAAAVGMARMYVGAHLPADIVGGISLGIAIGTISQHVLADED